MEELEHSAGAGCTICAQLLRSETNTAIEDAKVHYRHLDPGVVRGILSFHYGPSSIIEEPTVDFNFITTATEREIMLSDLMEMEDLMKRGHLVKMRDLIKFWKPLKMHLRVRMPILSTCLFAYFAFPNSVSGQALSAQSKSLIVLKVILSAQKFCPPEGLLIRSL